jgi:hypothetical protein
MSNAVSTDCRTEVGITVGLIDGLISIARVLRQRDLSAPEVAEALEDLRQDEDVAELLGIDDQWPDERVGLGDPDALS